MAIAEAESTSFGQATVASGAVAFLTRSVQGVVSLGVSVLMARLLTPGDFGIFAMVMPLGIFGMIAANYSVQSALLQHPAATDDDVNDYYHFAVRVAVGAALVIGVLGAALAAFYDEPRVAPIALALAAVVVVMPRGAMQEAQLKRALRFPLVHTLQLSTLTLGLAVGVVAAWQGMGYWALPLQVLTMEGVRLVAINAISDWRPRPRSGAGSAMGATLRRAWRSLFALRLASWANDQPDLVAIGRLGGSVVLGNYGAARRWAWYPFEDPYLALTEVVISSGARVRDDAERFRALVSRFVQAMLAVTLPLVAWIVVEAETVVHVLLGAQWGDAIPFLRVVGVAAFAAMISRTSTWVLLARGDTDRLVRWSVTRQLPATLVATAGGLAWGAMGIAIAMAVVSIALVVPAMRYVAVGTAMRGSDLARAAARPVAVSVAAACATAALSPMLGASPTAGRLVASMSLYALAFVAAWLALPGGRRDASELIAMLIAMLGAIVRPMGNRA